MRTWIDESVKTGGPFGQCQICWQCPDHSHYPRPHRLDENGRHEWWIEETCWECGCSNDRWQRFTYLQLAKWELRYRETESHCDDTVMLVL